MNISMRLQGLRFRYSRRNHIGFGFSKRGCRIRLGAKLGGNMLLVSVIATISGYIAKMFVDFVI